MNLLAIIVSKKASKIYTGCSSLRLYPKRLFALNLADIIIAFLIGISLASCGVRSNETEAPAVKSSLSKSCVIAALPSNVRSDPGGNIISSVEAGEPLSVTGKEESGWVQISAPTSGWIYKERTQDNCTLASRSAELPSEAPKQPGMPEIPSGEPSREELIEAVRSSVHGKTYTELISKQVPKLISETRTCNQLDVELDPLAGSPEIAKCPRVGATYQVQKTILETVNETQTRNCPSLPGPEVGWQVNKIDSNKWRVELSGKAWDVEQLENARANAEDGVRISSFVFVITTNQQC